VMRDDVHERIKDKSYDGRLLVVASSIIRSSKRNS
jgi:hypothetical protein